MAIFILLSAYLPKSLLIHEEYSHTVTLKRNNYYQRYNNYTVLCLFSISNMIFLLAAANKLPAQKKAPPPAGATPRRMATVAPAPLTSGGPLRG